MIDVTWTEQTDRELLEMAAKAAGLNVVDADDAGLRISSDGCCTGYRWNPLTDDGDALRLAVNLGITDLALAVGRYVMLEKHREGDNIEAITRRAIVRAAAEIGKARP